jgi:acyl carrier protein
MDISEFIKYFGEQFEETPLSVIKPATRIRDLEEWDSLHALSIMAMVSLKYKVNITPEELKRSQTISDIFEVVNSKL